MIKIVSLVFILFQSLPISAKVNYSPSYFTKKFSSNLSKNEIIKIKKEIFSIGGKAVPILIKVMKGEEFPDKSRWVATFLLGRLVGKKSSPFISRFIKHNNWILRMASLKTLLALKDKRYGELYSLALRDKSMLVRKQALENIRKLRLLEYAPEVLKMLFNDQNYYKSKNKKSMTIINQAILTLGLFQYKKALPKLLDLINEKNNYNILNELDFALMEITEKKSPKNSKIAKLNFWKSYSKSL